MGSADLGGVMVFGDAQTAKLDEANGRTTGSIEIVETCERIQAEAIADAEKRPWWQIFGS